MSVCLRAVHKLHVALLARTWKEINIVFAELGTHNRQNGGRVSVYLCALFTLIFYYLV